MRFEVPQFIDVEDKIFGPFTWRQFLYLGGGVGMAVALFFTNFLLFLFIGLPLALLGAALSFYKVNNRPFSYFLESIMTYSKSQRLYKWEKKTDHVYSEFTPNTSKPSNIVVAPKPKNKGDIASLSRKLELQALQKSE